MTRTFAPIEAGARLMVGFPHPWFVSGGWAIDLFRNEVTRDHEDLEIGTFRADQGDLYRHFAGWRIHRAYEGEWVPWLEGEYIELPYHQAMVRAPEGDSRDPQECEFFLNDATDGLWVFRRNPAITRPVATLARRAANGLPILTPEVQLLYKAYHHRPRDEHDFHGVLPILSPEQREWLKAAISANSPDDPWLAELGMAP